MLVSDAGAEHFGVVSFCSPDTLLLDLHPNAKMILGTRNIAFMHGPDHKALRKSFLALFTRKALSIYVQKQDVIIREHLEEWMKSPEPRELRLAVRDMNAETSQEVFVGECAGRMQFDSTFCTQFAKP